MSYEAPYEGLRVVDLSQGIAGPYCAMLLAQYGADVIKVEPPEGDWARHLGQKFGDHAVFSVTGNLGKRSIVLDLKTQDDQETLWQLLDRADIFLEGFRPGVIGRLGFGYDAVAARNPRILYLSISGFGQTGPLAEKPAMDPILQAFTGFMMANADDQGTPQRSTPIVVDMSCALYAFQAVSAALFGRLREERGRKIEVSLMQAAANLQSTRMMQFQMFGNPPKITTAPAGAYQCADGYIFLVILKQSDFDKICALTGLDELAQDPRFQSSFDRAANADEINRQFSAVFATKPVAHWNRIFTEQGFQNEQILDYHQFLAHPQVAATELISWLEQPGAEQPVAVPNPPGTPPLKSGTRLAHAPTLGEHSTEILAELAAAKAATKA